MRESNLRELKPFSEWTIRADETERRIAHAMRLCVGNHLRKMYGEVLKEPLPRGIAWITSNKTVNRSKGGDYARRGALSRGGPLLRGTGGIHETPRLQRAMAGDRPGVA
jgi:hypothetical protein